MTITESPRKSGFIVFLLLLAAALAVYSQTLSYGFLNTWDDPAYIVNNAAAHGFSWEHIKTAFSRFYVGNYAPLHIVSYMLDYLFWGLNPQGYIFHNIFLHALNGFLLYLLLRRLALDLYPAILSALFYVVHPVQVESVVWISQRKNVLAMAFYLLAIHCYVAYRNEKGVADKKQYGLALFFFACALLTKSVTVVLPAMLLLYDRCISRRSLFKAIPDKLPFMALAFMTAFIAMLSQSAEYGGGGRTAFHGGGIWQTLLTMLPIFVSYLRMTLFPSGLSIVYAPEIRTNIDTQVLLALLILSVLAAVGYWLYKRQRTIFFWYASIPLGILPVSQLVPLVTLMNDRYLYFPLLGGAACFGFLGQYLATRLPASREKIVVSCFMVVIALYGYASFQRSLVWRSSYTLWQDAAEKQPDSAIAWLVLGEEQVKQGDAVLAEKSFNRAHGICRGVECHHVLEKLATLYIKSGRFDKAEKNADELIERFPGSANGYILKGSFEYQKGQLVEAEKLFLKGVSLDPRQPSALNALGNIYLASGRPAEAKEKLKAAELLGNPTAELYYSMACAEAMLAKPADALNYLEQALRLGYNRPEQIFKNRELDSLKGLSAFNILMQRYFPGKRL